MSTTGAQLEQRRTAVRWGPGFGGPRVRGAAAGPRAPRPAGRAELAAQLGGDGRASRRPRYKKQTAESALDPAACR